MNFANADQPHRKSGGASSPETESEQRKSILSRNVTAPQGRLIVAQDEILGRINTNDLVPKGRLRISQDVILGALLLHADVLAPPNEPYFAAQVFGYKNGARQRVNCLSDCFRVPAPRSQWQHRS